MHDLGVRPRWRALGAEGLDGELLWQVLDAVPDGIVLIDEGGRILLANRQVEALFGYERTELLGGLAEQLLPPRLHTFYRALRQRYWAELRPRVLGADMGLQGRRSDGTEFPLEVGLGPLYGPQGALVVATLRDLSEPPRPEVAGIRSDHDLCLVEERERIGRDLQDRVIQHLFATSLAMHSLRSRLHDSEMTGLIAEMVEQLDLAIAEIRSIVFALAMPDP